MTLSLRRLALGAALAVLVVACDHTQSPTQPATQSVSLMSSAVDYTAVGASDAIGIGASVPCVPFVACPSGTGYVQDLTRELLADGRTVTLLNLGLPGAVLSPSIESLGNSLNRGIPYNFIDQELPFSSKTATLITVFAGGNDANTIAAAVSAGLGVADPNGYAQTQIRGFGQDFAKLISGLRSRSPSAQIIVLNLPNLAGLPFAAGDSVADSQMLQQISVGLSAQINSQLSPGVLVLDLMCDDHLYDSRSYSSDGFHPNDTGYAYLAGLLHAAATSGTAAAPLASCARMTLF